MRPALLTAVLTRTRAATAAHWRVVWGAGLVAAFSVQTLFGATLGLFLKPIEAEKGWTRAEIAFAFTLMTVLSPLSAPVFGWLIDRLPLRSFMMAGIALQSANIAAFSWIGGSPWTFYALCIALLLTGCGASALAMSKLVQGGFHQSLGKALGLLFAFVGVGTIFMPLLAQSLISSVGWRQTYQSLGLIGLLVAGSAGYWLVRGRPNPDPSAAHRAADASTEAAPAASMREMLRLRIWWLLALWNALFAFAVTGIHFHFATMLQDRGSTPAQSALAMSLSGIGALVGNLCTGWLLDRVSVRRLAVGVMLASAVPVLLLMVGSSVWAGLVAGLLLGLCGGADGILSHYLARHFFGSAIFGRALATQTVASSLGGGLAPWLAALLQQRTGNYQLVLSLAALAFVGAALVATLFPRMARAGANAPVGVRA